MKIYNDVTEIIEEYKETKLLINKLDDIIQVKIKEIPHARHIYARKGIMHDINIIKFAKRILEQTYIMQYYITIIKRLDTMQLKYYNVNKEVIK